MVRHRRRGFNLIELMVASAVALVLLTTALALLHRMSALQRRQEMREATRRSTALALTQLATELRRAGLGRPSGSNLESTSTTPQNFPPPLLLATPTQLAFVADLPRPDSDLNGISSLAGNQTGLFALQAAAVYNESSGPCDVYVFPSVNSRCDTRLTSVLFPNDSLPSCNDDPTARTCPWSLGRYRGGERLILANSLGRWVERQLTLTVHKDVLDRRVLDLSAPALPAELNGGMMPGFVSTPDRVFYRVRTLGTAPNQYRVLERNQCWGGSWVSLIAAGANTIATACNNTADGTGWERMLEYDIDPAATTNMGLVFEYLDGNGTVLAPGATLSLNQRRMVRQVRISANVVRRPPFSERQRNLIRYESRLTITLRN